MMRDRPYGAELLDEARRVLVEKIVPNLSPQTRYQALMVAKAMQLAGQEMKADIALEDKLKQRLSRVIGADGTWAQLSSLLSARIREGSFDESDDLYEFLRLVTAFKLRETEPNRLSDELESALDQLLVNDEM